MEASNMGTGSVYDWMRKILFDYEEDAVSIEAMNQALNNSTAGADGIMAWPYLADGACLIGIVIKPEEF